MIKKEINLEKLRVQLPKKLTKEQITNFIYIKMVLTTPSIKVQTALAFLIETNKLHSQPDHFTKLLVLAAYLVDSAQSVFTKEQLCAFVEEIINDNRDRIETEEDLEKTEPTPIRPKSLFFFDQLSNKSKQYLVHQLRLIFKNSNSILRIEQKTIVIEHLRRILSKNVPNAETHFPEAFVTALLEDINDNIESTIKYIFASYKLITPETKRQITTASPSPQTPSEPQPALQR